mmetsp:Transcript_105385/g.314772  ORF Transcript_105385/g.314772 Transcript_105385/m.314772 type:complete len:695 (-) Transcript_105385:159-2243(-)
MRGGLGRTGGIALNITGQVTQNLAAVLMSFAQQGQQTRKHKGAWYTGVLLIVVGALAVFASYGVAEQSLLGALISVQFVSNMVFCRCILGKRITLFMCVGTAVIIGGSLLCILNAPRLDYELNEEDLERLYLRNPVFQRFLLGEAMVWIMMDKLYGTYVDAHQRGQPRWGHEVLLPCMFVARAALPGSFSVVAAKNLAVLLRLTTEGRNMFVSPLLWLNLFFWLGGTGYWMRRMNNALAMFNGSFVIPLCQVNWSCFTIVTGGVFFEEFNHFDWDNMLLFVLGVCGNFAGVMMLQPGNGSAKVKDPEADQTCPEETPVMEEGASRQQMARLNSLPTAFPPVRRQSRSISKGSSFSAGSRSVVSSSSSPCPSASGGERRKHRISTVGLIPLVLDGVTEERTESGTSSARNRQAASENDALLQRLVQLEEAQMKQHLEVLGKIGELVEALHRPKGMIPVGLPSPCETGTPPHSGASTPQPTPPSAPMPPATPPPPTAPLVMLPAEGTCLLLSEGPSPCLAKDPAMSPWVGPSPQQVGCPSPPPPEVTLPFPEQSPPPAGRLSPSAAGPPSPPPALPHLVASPSPPGAVPASPPVAGSSPGHIEGASLATRGHTLPPLARRPLLPPAPPPVPPAAEPPQEFRPLSSRQAEVRPLVLGKPGCGADAGAGDSVTMGDGLAAELPPNHAGEAEEAVMPGA